MGASTTFKPSRRDVVNGEYITFRGRLKVGHIPPGGKLVELQVFTRRRWRTFAQPRASATTGRWSFQYRFEAVRGRVRFRFRARIRREASYQIPQRYFAPGGGDGPRRFLEVMSSDGL